MPCISRDLPRVKLQVLQQELLELLTVAFSHPSNPTIFVCADQLCHFLYQEKLILLHVQGEKCKGFLLCFSPVSPLFLYDHYTHTEHFCHQMWDFAHTKQFPVTPGGCLTIQHNTDTIYSEITLNLTRISSTRFSHPDLQCQSQFSDARFLPVLLISVQFSRSVVSDSL